MTEGQDRNRHVTTVEDAPRARNSLFIVRVGAGFFTKLGLYGVVPNATAATEPQLAATLTCDGEYLPLAIRLYNGFRSDAQQEG